MPFLRLLCWFKKVDSFLGRLSSSIGFTSLQCESEFSPFYFKPLLDSSAEGLFIDPHKTACFIWFAFVLNTAKTVTPLAMIPLVVVVEFDLPDCFKNANVVKLQGRGNISVSELIILLVSLS